MARLQVTGHPRQGVSFATDPQVDREDRPRHALNLLLHKPFPLLNQRARCVCDGRLQAKTEDKLASKTSECSAAEVKLAKSEAAATAAGSELGKAVADLEATRKERDAAAAQLSKARKEVEAAKATDAAASAALAAKKLECDNLQVRLLPCVIHSCL